LQWKKLVLVIFWFLYKRAKHLLENLNKSTDKYVGKVVLESS